MQKAVPLDFEKPVEKNLLTNDSDTTMNLSADDDMNVLPQRRRNIDDIFDTIGEGMNLISNILSHRVNVLNLISNQPSRLIHLVIDISI